ncbi:MAG: hypothetical protein LKJ03_10750 [Enterococcaceae bacterium]|nr:hypothetical protein [Enterococcaceae bacterium]MCI1918509.1 hypothetical protein [Enterococcaceae bacterium]
MLPSIYTKHLIKKDPPLVRFDTAALDHLAEPISFYYDGHQKIYTDDGYFCHELKRFTDLTKRERVLLAQSMASWLFAEFDETIEEFYFHEENENAAVTRMLQLTTAMTTAINLERAHMIKLLVPEKTFNPAK